MAAAQAQLAVAQQQLDMTVAKVNAGAANVADSLNSVVQVGNAQLAILTAQQSLRAASAALTRLVGRRISSPRMPSDTVDSRDGADRQRHGHGAGARRPDDSADAGADRVGQRVDQRRRRPRTSRRSALGRELQRQRHVGTVRLRQQSVSVHAQRRTSA